MFLYSEIFLFLFSLDRRSPVWLNLLSTGFDVFSWRKTKFSVEINQEAGFTGTEGVNWFW